MNQKRKKGNYWILILALVLIGGLLASCNNEKSRKKVADSVESAIQNSEQDEPGDNSETTGDVVAGGGTSNDGNAVGNNGTDSSVVLTTEGDNHPLFSAGLGNLVSMTRLGAVDPDPTGYAMTNDMDGDGILDDQEVTSNPYVADYPRIVTRIALPITMEIRVSETDTSSNFSETVDNSDVTQTINNSMESKHYNQFNLKTMPTYTTKEGYNDTRKTSDEYGYEYTDEQRSIHTSATEGKASVKPNFKIPGPLGIGSVGGEAEYSIKHTDTGTKDRTKTTHRNENHKVETSLNSYGSTERQHFENVGFTDNLDRNGIDFKDEKIEQMAQRFRSSRIGKNEVQTGPNDGVVRASLFIKNTSVNIPVRVSNIKVTLSFRTPSGTFLPVKTFTLREDDFSIYNQDVMGGQEFGPYAIEIDGLNSNEVKSALANGYVPQIHVVSYDLNPVEDTNYAFGKNNLKTIEETAKGRTAQIIVRGTGINEMYRVVAFDKDPSGNNFSPGISLKKALFSIFRDPLQGESWDPSSVTVPDDELGWKPGKTEHTFTEGASGDSWQYFETYIKTYTDEFSVEHKVETIKRIKSLAKYNPFDIDDNPTYNPQELISTEDMRKMKYWVIMHNGEYFDSDINDPIWVGDRYEIVLVDVGEFNNHFDRSVYDPILSQEPFTLNTIWNELTNQNEFDRSVYLGKVIKGETIHLEVDLNETYHLFAPTNTDSGFGYPIYFPQENANVWYDFKYSFEPEEGSPQGVPEAFTYEVEGGANALHFTINPSRYALKYKINFHIIGNPGSQKSIFVNASDLVKNGNSISITRKTLDGQETSSEIGAIADGTYKVNVVALSNFNVDGRSTPFEVATTGTDVTVHAPTDPSDPTDSYAPYFVDVNAPSGAPSGFDYLMEGNTNRVNLKIGASSQTEYYKIQVYGPLNYGGYDELTPSYTYWGHAGSNEMVINNPVAKPNESGLYKIEVYAVNYSGSIENTVLGTIPSDYLIVDYDNFQSQKIYIPKLSTDLQKVGAIDLEVNFNDGSGWYRLGLSSEDFEPANSNFEPIKVIDLQKQYYAEQGAQKFHVYLTPPSSENGSPYNVFSGGRAAVDVFLRTVPYKKYRDTFWRKPLDLVVDYNAALEDNAVKDLIYFREDRSQLTGRNIIKEWSQSSRTDVTRLESTLSCAYRHTFDQVGNNSLNTEQCDELNMLKLVYRDKAEPESFFFAPLEERTYQIKASLEPPSDPTISDSRPETPTFKVHKAHANELVVHDFAATHAESFKVYYKQTRAEDVEDNDALYGWAESDDLPAAGNAHFPLYSLAPKTYYSFIVVASNTHGKSQRSQPFEVRTDPPIIESVSVAKLWVTVIGH